MSYDFLDPIETEVISFTNQLSVAQLGKKVVFHTDSDFPDLSQVKIALLGIYENRGNAQSEPFDLIAFRKHFYAMYPGNWEFQWADLGNIQPGLELSDTYYAVTEIVSQLLKDGVYPIVLGGSQDLTYPIYRAFDIFEQMVNLVAIDYKLDIGKESSQINADSYMSGIVLTPPFNLLNFSNLGFQTYYNAQEEIDLIDKLYFDAYRLGEVCHQISMAEPVLRDADLVSVDLLSVKSSDTRSPFHFMPNGFTGKEICILTRYAGISEKVRVFSVFNISGYYDEAVLLSQMVWYFLEGFQYRRNEYPNINPNSFLRFIVPVDNEELIFYKSTLTERWWMEVPNFYHMNNKGKRNALLPCSQEEYLKACDQEIPERWWKAQRKALT
jgi:hypothetical protein